MITIIAIVVIVAVAAFVAGLLVGRKHQKRLNAIEIAARG